MAVGILHFEGLDVETVVNLEVGTGVGGVEGIELGLRLAQGYVHLAGLQHLVGVVGRHAQGLSAVDDVLAQSQCQARYALLGFLVADGIVVERAQHAADIGIVVVAILPAHHGLQYHSHLLLVYHVLCGGHVSLGVAVVNRGIDSLDGASQHTQHLILVLKIGYHVSAVDACKRLVVGIFEQRRGAYGYRRVRGIEESEEVCNERIGQLGTQKGVQDFVVGRIAQGYLVEIVLLHESIEDVGTQHHRLRNLHRGVGKPAELGMPLDNVVEESQSAPLAAERAVADTRKVGIAVELAAVEDGNGAYVLHVAILHDGIEDDLLVGIYVLQLVPCDVFQEGRHGKDSPRTEPPAHVVARDVAQHGVVGDAEDVVLKLLQIMHSHDLGMALWVTEDEVAEAHVLFEYVSEVAAHGLRVLVDKEEALGLGLGAVIRLRTLKDKGHILVAAAYLAQKLQARLRVLVHRTLLGRHGIGHGEAHVGDDAQRVVMVLLVECHGLLVVSCQHHLGPSAHTHRGGMGVEGLGRELLALHEDIAVEVGQYGRIETYAVFDQKYHLHAGFGYVVLEVHLVLNQLDDRQYEVGVAEPAEHIVEHLEVFVLHALGDAVREGGEHHAGHIWELRLHRARHVESIVVGIAGHTYNKVNIGCLEHTGGLLGGGNLREHGRIAKSELHILVVDLLLYPAVVLEHERIVGVCNYQNIIYTAHHQVHERYVLEQEFAPLLWYFLFHGCLVRFCKYTPFLFLRKIFVCF